MFKLKRPCANCPFRKDTGGNFGLPAARLDEIVNAPAFQCHKTVDYSEDEPGQGDHPQQCAGLMAILHRENKPNAIMQVAERFGALDPEQLDPDGEAFGALDEVYIAHDNVT